MEFEEELNEALEDKTEEYNPQGKEREFEAEVILVQNRWENTPSLNYEDLLGVHSKSAVDEFCKRKGFKPQELGVINEIKQENNLEKLRFKNFINFNKEAIQKGKIDFNSLSEFDPKIADEYLENPKAVLKAFKEISGKEIEIINIPENLKQSDFDKFQNPNLLEEIKKEISKIHLKDDNLKMTLFLTYITGLLKNPNARQSFQITGTTSTGKDNIQHSCLNHFPDESYIFVTSATQATLEDDIKDIPILAFSEVNLFREGGANKHLLEVIKQRIEGGTTAIKKDLRENNKFLRFEKGEQGVVTFGTTEAEQDEELATRLMKGTIMPTPEKIKSVNENTFDYFSNPKRIIDNKNKEDSWIKKGLNHFWKNPEELDVYIPYASYLKDKISGKEIFDNSNPRSQRDIKRLLHLTCAMAWLFQEQRQKIEINGQKFIVSEPQDFINTLKYSNEFFNQTYGGFDERVSKCLEFIQSKKQNLEYWWVEKISIQNHLGVKKRETINNYLWSLEQVGLVERAKASELSNRYTNSTFKGNSVYYRAVQKASNKRLISVQLNELKTYLEQRIKEDYEGNNIQKGGKEGEISENGRFLTDASKNTEKLTDASTKTDASKDA